MEAQQDFQMRKDAVMILIVVFFFCMYHFIVPGEEGRLEKSLGEEFIRYKKSVRKWL